MDENNGIKIHDNFKEILTELLNNSLNLNLTELENENEEEIINLENFKKFFDEYSSIIEIMFQEISEFEKKNHEKEEKDEKENKTEKEEKKEKEKEIKKDKEEKKEKEKEIKKDKEEKKEKENKREHKKEKEKKQNHKKEPEKKLNNKKESNKKNEEKKENKENKDNKSMARSQTLSNLKEGKKEESHYLKTEPSTHKTNEKKTKTMLHSQTERTLKPVQKTKGNSSSKGKKISTNNTNKTTKKNIKKNAAYYLKTYCKENWFENILSYLPISDRNILIESSKIFKEYQLQKMNHLKEILLNQSNIKEGSTIEDKIMYYKNKYSEEELNKGYLDFEMSKGTVKAIELLNNEEYTKIFKLNNLDDELNEIYIIYRCLCYLINEKEIAEIKSDKLFWIKFCEFLNEKSNGKIGDYIKEVSKNFNFDDKTGLLLEKLVSDIKSKIVPSYYCKICTTTGLFSFLIKDALEYNGVLSLNKKTQVSRLYHNLESAKTIIEQLNKYIKYLTKL